MLGSGSCGAIWMLHFETTCTAVKIPLADEGLMFSLVADGLMTMHVQLCINSVDLAPCQGDACD